MATIQVKHVPDEVHAVLAGRARAAHQSLQEYLLERLTEAASRPTLDEAVARAGSHRGGNAPLAETTRLIRQDRDDR